MTARKEDKVSASEMRQAIITHPLLKTNQQRLKRLTGRVVFMSIEALEQKLSQLNQEAEQKKYA